MALPPLPLLLLYREVEEVEVAEMFILVRFIPFLFLPAEEFLPHRIDWLLPGAVFQLRRPIWVDHPGLHSCHIP